MQGPPKGRSRRWEPQLAAEATAASGGSRELRLGQCSGFSKRRKAAAEKTANTTRAPLPQKVRRFFVRRFAIDWNHEHRGRAWDGTAEILQKYRVGPTGAREKVPGQGTGRGGDGHDRFQLHLRSGPEVRRAGEHHPQLDGRGGRKAGRGVCRGQSPGGAGDRSPGGAGSPGPGGLPAAAGGREQAGQRDLHKAAGKAGRGCPGQEVHGGGLAQEPGGGAGGRHRDRDGGIQPARQL